MPPPMSFACCRLSSHAPSHTNALSQVGGVERIVSFIGVGLLLLIGYFAPVPPRRPENAS